MILSLPLNDESGSEGDSLVQTQSRAHPSSNVHYPVPTYVPFCLLPLFPPAVNSLITRLVSSVVLCAPTQQNNNLWPCDAYPSAYQIERGKGPADLLDHVANANG